MNDIDIRALLDEASSGPRPAPTIDVAAAVRQAESIRRRRRVAAVLTSTIAVAVAVAVPVAPTSPHSRARAVRTAPATTPSGPATGAAVSAPDRFDPLVRQVRLGWLPGTLLNGQWELTATGQQFGGFEPGTDQGLLVDVLARGQRFGDHDHGLGLPDQPRERPAQPVAGRPAVCIGEAAQAGSCSALRWEYAPGAYARVSYAGRLGTDTAATVQVLRRVAESVTLITGDRVRLPFQVDLAGTGLHPTSTLVDIRNSGTGRNGERWSASLELSAGPQNDSYGFHGVIVEMLSVPGPIDRDRPANTTVDAHSATLGHNGDETSLAIYDVHGSRLLIDVTTPGRDPLALYPAVHPAEHPADPAGWTS